MKSPEKQVAFVTGAASGIGLATVRRFVEKGTAVVALDNKIGDELRALEGDGDILAFEGDVRDAACRMFRSSTSAVRACRETTPSGCWLT
jgi:NAD(P)-dependent dehydrogenase (short-subunit alcohol dehydrogenase family)